MAFVNNVFSVWALFLQHMQTMRGSADNGSDQIIREVQEGEWPIDSLPVPYVTIRLLNWTIKSRANDQRVWTGKVTIRVVSSIQIAGAAIAEIIAKMTQVQDTIDAFQKPEGTTGFDNSDWSVTYQTSPEHGNLIMGDQVFEFQVVVARGAN